MFNKMKVDLTIMTRSFIKITLVYLLLASSTYARSMFDESQNAFGITPLMSSVSDQDITGVKFFAKADGNYIDQQNIGGATALHLAARGGNLEIVKTLIENNANPNIKDNEGWTPLMRAVIAHNSEAISYLLDNKADASILNSSSESVIYQAASVSCSSCLKILLEQYDFETNMGLKVLRTQINASYEVARNKEDSEVQNILTNYLNLITANNNNVSEDKKYSFRKKDLPVEKEVEFFEEEEAPKVPETIKYKLSPAISASKPKKFVVVKGEDKKVDVRVNDKIEKVIILDEYNEVIGEIDHEDLNQDRELNKKEILFKFHKIHDNSKNAVEIEENNPKRTFKLKKISQDSKNIVQKRFENDEIFDEEDGDYSDDRPSQKIYFFVPNR